MQINITYRVLLFSFLLLIAYLPGTKGALYYDDYANLEAISQVENLDTALKFITTGTAGPLGRPLALATFIPFHEHWPDNSQIFLITNVIIHLINFLLLFILGKKLICYSKFNNNNNNNIALWASFFWAILPLLASTNLIAIQRMTSLSALFTILGLLAFIHCYKYYRSDKYIIGYVSQLASIVFFTTLSILCKENGVLTPIYALSIHLILAKNKIQPFNKNAEKLFILTLSIPLLYVLYYISPLNRDWFFVSETRNFSSIERLLTQSVILWDYLYNAYIPNHPSAFGPFHDYYGIVHSQKKILTALTSWLIIFIVAIYLFIKGSSLFLFALLWFFTGHLIESTTIHLELYYEHRNYLALYGICFVIAVYSHAPTKRYNLKSELFFKSYIFILWIILFAITTRWGNPLVAAEAWTYKHPGSARAVLHFIFLQESETQDNVSNFHKIGITTARKSSHLNLLDKTKAVCPDCLDTRLIALLYSCELTNEVDSKNRVHELIDIAESGKINRNLSLNLAALIDAVNKNLCPGIENKDLAKLIDRLISNTASSKNNFNVKFLFSRAMVAENQGNYELLEEILREAEKIAPLTLPVLQYQVYHFKKRNELNNAILAIERRRNIINKTEIHNESEITHEILLELENGILNLDRNEENE